MKTFGDLKVGDIVFSKALECNVIREQQIEHISFEKDVVNIRFVNDLFYIIVLVIHKDMYDLVLYIFQIKRKSFHV